MPRYIDLDKLNEYPIRLNHYDKENGNANFVYGIESVLEYANSLPVFKAVDVELGRYRGQWISTKEKMPENDTSVLICACGHRVTAYYNHLKKAFILTEDEKLYYETAAVSHWMPLPEVPQEYAININVPDSWAEKEVTNNA